MKKIDTEIKMREGLPDIKELHFLEGDIDKTIERAYQMGRTEGVIQYLEEQIKKQGAK